VQQHIGVAVSDQMQFVGQIDAAQPQRTTRGQPMRVMSDSDP
jgi:hypothetical protein